MPNDAGAIVPSKRAKFSSSCAFRAAESPLSNTRTASGYVVDPIAPAMTNSTFCDSAYAAV